MNSRRRKDFMRQKRAQWEDMFPPTPGLRGVFPPDLAACSAGEYGLLLSKEKQAQREQQSTPINTGSEVK